MIILVTTRSEVSNQVYMPITKDTIPASLEFRWELCKYPPLLGLGLWASAKAVVPSSVAT